jgi:hypothetical protein
MKQNKRLKDKIKGIFTLHRAIYDRAIYDLPYEKRRWIYFLHNFAQVISKFTREYDSYNPMQGKKRKLNRRYTEMVFQWASEIENAIPKS